MCSIIVIFCAFAFVSGQKTQEENLTSLSNVELTERMGNFSIELLYWTLRNQVEGQNIFLSPTPLWTVLALLSEGAAGKTASEINYVLRIRRKDRNALRVALQSINHGVNTNAVELAEINLVFMEQKKFLLPDFQTLAETVYKTRVLPLDFNNKEGTAKLINEAISRGTYGRIQRLVNGSYFEDTKMILTSATSFRGDWSVPFNKSFTTITPFYDNAGLQIGEVKMMFNRFTYPFADIKELQASVIEIPYEENRFSMLIMLPNPGVSVESMFRNFARVSLNKICSELNISKEHGNYAIDAFIPRFKIEYNNDLAKVLKDMGIRELFHPVSAELPIVARSPVHVSRVIHKVEIEVTEEGAKASKANAAVISNRTVQFRADRPFCFFVIEKVTQSVILEGVYATPSV